jgi:hypothetical protein
VFLGFLGFEFDLFSLEGNGGIKMDLPAALQAAEESWALYAKDTLPGTPAYLSLPVLWSDT